MEDAIIQRIEKVISFTNLSQTRFSSHIKFPQQTLNKQLNGISRLSLDLITSILDGFPEISAEWLLRGEGPMLKGSVHHNIDIDLSEHTTVSNSGSGIAVAGASARISQNGNDQFVIEKLIEQNLMLVSQNSKILDALKHTVRPKEVSGASLKMNKNELEEKLSILRSLEDAKPTIKMRTQKKR